jgi:hypothetical protein
MLRADVTRAGGDRGGWDLPVHLEHAGQDAREGELAWNAVVLCQSGPGI